MGRVRHVNATTTLAVLQQHYQEGAPSADQR